MRKISKLCKIVEAYFSDRNLTVPNTKDSLVFLITELGELLNVLTKLESGWVRNNPLEGDSLSQALRDELGDCFMMTLRTYMSYSEEFNLRTLYFESDGFLKEIEESYTSDPKSSCINLLGDICYFYENSFDSYTIKTWFLELSDIAKSLELDLEECMLQKLLRKGGEKTKSLVGG